MGKTPKQKKRDLAHRLHRLGLRKELAKRIAENATTVRGQLPGSASKTIKEMRAKVDDLGPGGRRTRAVDETEDAPEAGSKATKKRSRKARAKKLAQKQGFRRWWAHDHAEKWS